MLSILGFWEYLSLFALVFVFNIMPAFAPPTWLVLAYFKMRYGGDVFSILFTGLFAATAGRFVMYHYSSFFHKFLPKENKEALDFVKKLSEKSQNKVLTASFIYSLSPLSSNIMFLFAGASRIPELPLFLGFFLGRFVSYGMALIVYVGTVAIVEESLNINLKNVADIITFLIAIAMMFVDWRVVYKKLTSLLKKG